MTFRHAFLPLARCACAKLKISLVSRPKQASCRGRTSLKRSCSPACVASGERRRCMKRRSSASRTSASWKTWTGVEGFCRHALPPLVGRLGCGYSPALTRPTAGAAVRRRETRPRLASCQAADLVHAGKLVKILARFRPPPAPISLVYPSNRQVPLRVRVLLDALVKENGERRA